MTLTLTLAGAVTGLSVGWTQASWVRLRAEPPQPR